MAEQAKYAYTTVPSKLRDLLKKAPNMGRPDKVTVAWLKTAGWTSSNDASMIPVLRFAGLVGADGRPGGLWDAVRAPTRENRATFAGAIRKAYADLFALYPDAHRKDAEALRNFFRAHTGGGEQVQSKLVQTFQTLAEFGDFDVDDVAVDTQDGEPAAIKPRAAQIPKKPAADVSMLGSGMALTLNIQLQLPATADSEVYDKLFASMRKHLMGLAEGTT